MRPGVESVCFGGTEASRFESSSFGFHEASFLPGNCLPTHSHPHATLTLVWAGGFTESSVSGDVICSPNTIVFKPGELPHSDQAGPAGARCLIIEVLRQVFGQEAELPRLQGLIAIDSQEAHTIRSLILREFAIRDAASLLALEGLVLELLAVYVRAPRRRLDPRPRWLDQSLALLHDGFHEPFSVARLAEAIGIGPLELALTFRRHLGCSVGSYQRQLRLEEAARQLGASDDSLSKIALNAGFFDQAHFSRQFKKSTGLTPTQFRARAKTRQA